MKTLKDIEYFDGVKVLVRVDFNVPIKNGVVADDFRIRAALSTINFLLEKGAVVILMSHLEASDGSNPSLKPVSECLAKLGIQNTFITDYKKAHELTGAGGKCFLLENLRFFEGEKANDSKFAEQLASLADIYVNDAFSVSHRKHASVVGVPSFIPGYAGLQLEKEIANLSKAFNPAHPFLFILGGAKFDTKLPLMEKFLTIADIIFVGGALANDIFKAKGYEVGGSLVSKGNIALSAFANNPTVIAPIDILNEKKAVLAADNVSKIDKIMDAGPKTIEMLKEKVSQAKFILWNGPLGMYENGFKEGTLELARIMSEATTNGAETIVGGGDTLAAIAELGSAEKISFISTGGGAMLDFLANGTLPGIEALEN